jgi:acetate kinase
MIVATVNAGSTSVRLAAFKVSNGAPIELARERHAGRDLDPANALADFAARIDKSRLVAVAHRVVHGGTQFRGPVLIDDAVRRQLDELSTLAPLHNPVAVAWIEAATAVFGATVKQVAVFDTAFFADLPAQAARYAIPARWGSDFDVRRYGFHGLAHEAMWRRWCELRPELDRGGRLVTLQLGGGCSMAAIDRGRPIETSMGFTPLEGLVMATRSGDVDPSIVPYLAARLGEPSERVIERLNSEAGLLGVSGITSDMSALIADPAPSAQLAVSMFCTRARKYLGAYLALLEGCDGIVFGGGIGEHIPEVRTRILEGMQWAGIELDPQANVQEVGEASRISAPRSGVQVYVVAVDEEQALARAALLSRHPGAIAR